MPHHNNIDELEHSSFGLEFHHVAVIVDDLDYSLKHFYPLFGKDNISKVFHVTSQKVKVCFIKNGIESNLELVQPLGEDSIVYKLLKKRVNYYHVAYKVSDIQHSIKRLEEELNYKALSIFDSEAFDGKPCVFMFSPDGLLIELIEK